VLDTTERTISRTYDVVDIIATNVSRLDGTTEVTYGTSNPFDMYQSGIQKFFLSQCYSKNYPMTTDVRFEQAPPQ
jgi:hypothetical protein